MIENKGRDRKRRREERKMMERRGGRSIMIKRHGMKTNEGEKIGERKRGKRDRRINRSKEKKERNRKKEGKRIWIGRGRM